MDGVFQGKIEGGKGVCVRKRDMNRVFVCL